MFATLSKTKQNAKVSQILKLLIRDIVRQNLNAGCATQQPCNDTGPNCSQLHDKCCGYHSGMNPLKPINTKVGKKAGNTYIGGKYCELLGNKLPCRQDDIRKHLHVSYHLNIGGRGDRINNNNNNKNFI